MLIGSYDSNAARCSPPPPLRPDAPLFPLFNLFPGSQSCSGFNLTACPAGMLQFNEPANGVSGYTGLYPADAGPAGIPYSVIDTVRVPAQIPTGDYLLSWRWDCEQSHQVWQNCADVVIAA